MHIHIFTNRLNIFVNNINNNNQLLSSIAVYMLNILRDERKVLYKQLLDVVLISKI